MRRLHPSPWLVVALLLAVGTGDRAWAASVRAQVDSPNASVGSAVTLTITVSGVRRVGNVRMPSLSSFDVIQGPVSMRSRVVNGRARQQVELTYYLYPKKIGTFTIDPIGVAAGGTTLWTSPIALEVSESWEPSGPVEDHFLEAFIEPEAPCAGQVIVYHLRFGFASSVNNPHVTYPDWGGLLKEASVEAELTDSYEVIGGRTFHVVDWRIPLFSLRPGEYEIGPAELTFDQVIGVSRRTRPLFNDPLFDQLFAAAQMKPVQLTTESLEVEVLPLPEAGKPENFSGLVGTARLQGNLSRTRCAVGESATLTLLLQGLGNLRDVELGLEVPEGLKVYAEDPLYELEWGGNGPAGRIAQRFDLVPTVAGEAIIPEIEVSYFDPVRRRYRTAEAGPFRLNIDPGEDGSHGAHSADLLVDERAIDLLNREPYEAVLSGGARRLGGPPSFLLVAALLVLPLGAFGVCATVRRRQLRLADPEQQRRRLARRGAMQGLDEAESRSGDRVAAAARADEAIRTFLAERAGVATGVLSPEELGEAVRAAGAADAGAEVTRWMTDVAAVRYAGRSEPSVDVLVRRARQLLDQLEEELV